MRARVRGLVIVEAYGLGLRSSEHRATCACHGSPDHITRRALLLRNVLQRLL